MNARFCLPLPAALAVLAGLALAGPAAAQGLFVVGDTSAAACYRAAKAGRTDGQSLATCNFAVIETTRTRDRAATYVNRAIVHLNREEYEEALADVDSSFPLRVFGEAYATRGVIYFHMDRMQDSVDQATLAIEYGDLDEPEKVYYNRALAYEKLDMIEEAYYDYRKAVELNPSWRLPKQELERFEVLPAEGPAS